MTAIGSDAKDRKGYVGTARSKGKHRWILSHQAREGDDAKEVVDGDDRRREEGEGASIA